MAGKKRSKQRGSRRDILITSALPYANGPIHLGHLVEYVQADIWARFQRLRGHRCLYVCADDAHGTPIMLRAQEEGIEPEQLIARFHREHLADFQDFAVRFDNYHSTHSPENRALVEDIYRRLQENGHILRRTIRQAYDPVREMFLPDRFIRGLCPKCRTPDQYGDHCESCGATYNAAELLEPVSVLSGQPPVERESEHYFFDLPAFEPMLRQWVGGGRLQPETAHKLEEWFATGLEAWDISRDAPYFGFRIPGAKDKYFYVWMDAPVGYLASLRNLCEREGLDFDAFLRPGGDTELYHFIGKDIMYFHGLFWPAVLRGSGLRLPDSLFVHGFLTVNGHKMSKSRGTFITARAYLEHLDPEYLRYYFAYRLDAGTGDIDLNLEDFSQRINSDLVGKVVNIASRCARLLADGFAGQTTAELADEALFREGAEAAEPIAAAYEGREYGQAMRRVMRFADSVNRYIDRRRPWQLAKENPTDPELQRICSMGINCFRQLAIYLKPVLPALAERAEEFLAVPPLRWQDAAQPLPAQRLRPFRPLLRRVRPQDAAAMLAVAARPEETPAKAPAPERPEAPAAPRPAQAADRPSPSPETPTIDIQAFARLDLRVARIVEAERVDGADKLLRLQLDLGDGQRTVLAGIRRAYEPESLPGKMVIVVANLAPRRMRFGVSEGMILAAGDGQEIFLLSPDAGAQPGMKVR